jgi:hypothetical protein
MRKGGNDMSVYEFQIGDIVKVKGFNEKVEYFIVTDTADFTQEGATKPDIECEIGQIFPITSKFELFNLNQDRLELVAGKKTKENAMMIDFIIKERQVRLGEYGEPMFVTVVKHNLGEIEFEEGITMKVAEPSKKVAKPRFGERELKALMNDDTGEKRLKLYIERMDTHLELLHKAIQENNEENIELQKYQLEQVRQELMKLEYFGLKQ